MQTPRYRLPLPHFVLALSVAAPALHSSTQGDNLLGAGTASRSLGGVGVASAPSVTGAIFSNPATLGFLAPEALRSAEFSTAFFQPRFTGRAGAARAESNTVYAIPSLALAASPGSDTAMANSPWRYGFAAYVVSGLGGDYRNTALDTSLAPTPFPLVATTRAELQIIESAPSVSCRLSPEWSVGLALHLDHGSFNLGTHEQTGLGLGFQPGVVYRPTDRLSLGLTYVSSSTIRYRDLIDFDADGALDDFTLQAPQQLKLGAAFELSPGRLQLAADLTWANWSDARGYRDFDWQDTWLLGASVQYHAVRDTLIFRAGCNIGSSPVKAHAAFNGAGVPGNTVNVQGKAVPTYYYESFRVISFPAIAERHVSLGLGWKISEAWSADLGYTHAFKTTLTQPGTDLLGAPTVLSSSLVEHSIELGLTHRY